MYRDYFNLKKNPFANMFDPDLVYLSEKEVEVLELLSLAIGEGREVVILTGAKGGGKSTLVQMVEQRFPYKEFLHLKLFPNLSRGEFISQLADKLRGERERKRVPAGLSELIFSSFRNIFSFSPVVFILEDAHHISDEKIFTELEELIRATVTVDFPLTVFLTGLPELLPLMRSQAPMLADISLKLSLPAISVAFLVDYFKFRLVKSGGASDVFPKETISLIYAYTQGDLKRVNLLAELGLMAAAQKQVKQVTPEILKELLVRYSDLVTAILPERENFFGERSASARVVGEMLTLFKGSVEGGGGSTPLIKEGAPSEAKAKEKKGGDSVLYSELLSYLSILVSQAEKGEKLNLKPLEGYARRIVSSLREGNELIFRALQPMPEYHLPRHMANVGIIATKIGFGLNYPESELVRLAEVALVHDLGMARLPRSIIDKPGRLTPEEFELVKEHPRYTYEMIREAGEEFHWIAEIAYQEHEKHQGQGYPRGLKGEEIHPFASIIQAADIFEAFSHPRAWRRKFITHDALQKVIRLKEDYLPSQVVKAMVNEFSLFPLNSYVQLNNGEIGRVVEIERDNLLRPKVEIVYDAKGNKVEPPKTVNLKEMPFLFIEKSIDEEELPK